MTAANLIMLKPLGEYEEAFAGEAGILPGMNLSLASDGEVVKGAATSAELCKRAPQIALEDALQGKTIVDVYTIHEPVMYRTLVPGEMVNVLLKDGEDVAIGANIVPEGGGTGLWIEAAGTEGKYHLEAVEALAPSGSNGRLACRVV